jgi:Spy/CpxP family protein refolding chaperone
MEVKMRSYIFFALTGIAIFMITMVGCRYSAMHNSHSPEKKAEMIVDHISDELDLSKSQEEKLNKIKDEVLAKHKEKKSKHGDLFNTIQAEIKKEKIDEKILVGKLNEMGKDREEMHLFMVSKFAEFHSILSKEQRETLVKKMDEFKEKFDSHFE